MGDEKCMRQEWCGQGKNEVPRKNGTLSTEKLVNLEAPDRSFSVSRRNLEVRTSRLAALANEHSLVVCSQR